MRICPSHVLLITLQGVICSQLRYGQGLAVGIINGNTMISALLEVGPASYSKKQNQVPISAWGECWEQR